MADKVIITKSKLDSLFDKIKKKINNVSLPITIDEMAEVIDLFDFDRALIDFLENKKNLQIALSQSNIREIRFKPNSLCTNAGYMCSECSQLEKIELKDTSNIEIFEGAFLSCRKLREVVLTTTAKAKNVNFMFASCNSLEIVRGTLDFSNCNDLTGIFNGISNIRELRFAENSIYADLTLTWADKLSDETIQSIINGLADLTGQTTKTIYFHTDVVNKLTTEQSTQILNKNWSIG